MNENSNKIKVKVITHEKVVFERDVDELYVQSTDGRLGILPNHIPVVCALDIGVTKVIVDKEPIHITTMAGVFQFSQNEATILTDIAELGDDIDLARANAARERAQARINAKDEKDDILRAQFALAKAIARISAKEKHI